MEDRKKERKEAGFLFFSLTMLATYSHDSLLENFKPSYSAFIKAKLDGASQTSNITMPPALPFCPNLTRACTYVRAKLVNLMMESAFFEFAT